MENVSEGVAQPSEQAGFGVVDPAVNVGLEGAFEGGGLLAPTVEPAVDEGHLAYEPKPLSAAKMLAYSSGGFGNGTWVALNNYLQPIFLGLFTNNAILIGLLSSQRGLESAIIQPIIGSRSDRSQSRFGRRRSYILLFMPFCIVLTVITPFLPQLVGAEPLLGIDPTALSLILVSLCIFLFTVSYNVAQDPYSALMADVTPQRQRGVINGIIQSVSFIGNLAILLVVLLLHAPYTVLYPLAGAALFVFYLPVVLLIREPKKLPGGIQHKRYGLRDYWRALRADGQVQLFFAVQFFLWFAINSVVVFITPYAVHVIGFSGFQATSLPIVLVIAIAVGAWPLGALSNRLSLKGVFFPGLACMAGASVAAIFLRDPLALYIILAIAGLGYAATQATGYPMLTRMVLPGQMGLYTGLNTTVASVASPISGAVAGALIDSLGYGVLFAVVGVSFALGLIPLALLRIDRSKAARARAAAAAAAGLAAAS